MKKQIQNNLKKAIRRGFKQVEKNKYFQKILTSPLPFRVVLFIILFVWSIIAMLTPIPAGWITMLFAFALLFGVKPIKRLSIRLMYMLRIPFLIEKYQRWRKKYW